MTAENSALVPVGVAPGTPMAIHLLSMNLTSQLHPSHPPDDTPDVNSAIDGPPAPAPTPAPSTRQLPKNNKPDDKDGSSESNDSQSASTGNLDNGKKRGTLVTKSFTLPRRTRPARSFKCRVDNCHQKFDCVHNLNQHH